MRYGVVEPGGASRFHELSLDEFKNMRTARDGLFEALYLEEKFDFLIENYLEFETELLAVAARHMVFNDREPRWMHNERNLIGRRIMNYLTTCRTYVDHAPKHLRAIYGAASHQKSEFKRAKSMAYDSLFGYRVMEAMRNYVQHHGYPIQSLSFDLKRAGNKERHGVLFTATPLIHVSALEEDHDFKAETLAEMKQRGETLDAKLLIREYMEGLSRAHARARELLQEDIGHWEAVVTKALDTASTAFGRERMTHVRLVTKHDDETYSYQAPVFQEPIERRKRFEEKNRAPHTLAASFVSGEVR